MNDVKFGKIDNLNNETKLKEEIWELLCLADEEFIPKLSERESSRQSSLSDITASVKPYSYFKNMSKQRFIYAVDENDEMIGFLSFSDNFFIDNLMQYSPSSYGTTAFVKKEWREKGIIKNLFRKWEEIIREEKNYTFLSGRTWSTNIGSMRNFEKNGFKIALELINHRGEDIHTLYYIKELK